jgi:hypothetical protein
VTIILATLAAAFGAAALVATEPWRRTPQAPPPVSVDEPEPEQIVARRGAHRAPRSMGERFAAPRRASTLLQLGRSRGLPRRGRRPVTAPPVRSMPRVGGKG